MRAPFPTPSPLSRIPRLFALPLLPLLFCAGSCNTVEFYQKAALSDPTMQYAESPCQLHWQQKVQYSDEGAAGGIGTTAGGGCGCY